MTPDQKAGIPEVVEFCRALSVYRPVVYLVEGTIIPYDGIGIYTTGVSSPPGLSLRQLGIDIQIQSRSMDFVEVYKTAGFLSKYRASIGPIGVDYGVPDPEIGGAECMITGTLIADELYPDSYIDIPETIRVIYIRYERGAEVLREFNRVPPNV